MLTLQPRNCELPLLAGSSTKKVLNTVRKFYGIHGNKEKKKILLLTTQVQFVLKFSQEVLEEKEDASVLE